MATKRLKKELEKIQPTSCWGDEPIKAELRIDKISKPETGRTLIPDEIKKIAEKVFKARLSKKNYKGQEQITELGLVEKWESGDVEYLVKSIYLSKLKDQTPKVYVSQDKNIKLLLALIEQQQFSKDEKRAEASFTLKEYAKLRGYTEKEIKVGGKFLTELKRDLISGAYTSYRINEIIINGKKYIAHGIPNFYILLEPKNPKDRWQIKFNTFYAESILKILKGKAKQYFTHYLKEIADRKTTKKPYLHFFYNQLIYRKQAGKTTIPKKVVNLLKEMGIAKFYLDRPQECFNVLRECLVYITSNYPEELEGIYFFNDFNKEKHLPLSSLKALKDFKYKDFKDLLKAISIEDIREAFISFVRQKGTDKELPTPKPQDDSEFVSQILEWLDKNINWEKMTKFTRKGTEQYLKDSLNLLGFNRLNELFKQEAQAIYPNAVRFLTKTLPQSLRKDKKDKALKHNTS